MTEKMTYTKALETVLTYTDIPEDVAEKLTALKASLEKRAAAKSKSGKPTKAQREAIDFANSALEFATEEPMLCKDIAENMTATGDFGEKVSPQKVAAAMKKLAEWGKVVKTEEKGKTYYALVG